IKERKFKEAEQHLLETINFNPNISFAYLNLGAVYSILKRYEDGIKMFEKSLTLAPNQVKALFGLGKIYSITGSLDLANKHFKRVVDLEPKGLLASHAKRAMASMPFEKPISLTGSSVDPKDIEYLYQAGYRAYLFTDYERAIEMYQKYLTKKDDDDFVWFSLGESCLRVGWIEKAIDSYQRAIDLNSTKALYFKSLAIAQNYMDRESEVIKCLNRAKQLGKNDSLTQTLWGKVLIKQKNYEEAIDNLNDAIRQNPNNLLAKYYLAIAFRKTNQASSALNYLEEIASSPINSPLKAAASKLKDELHP
ncbi:tetratricopeptide repeat protein, partial [bacterium]|nr:tetratricopeptide repeat protein [bacterium]